MSVLNMTGCVDGVFQSVPATRTTTAGGSYVDGVWTFLGKRWKAVRVDNRYWRNYCKCIVERIDDQ